MIPDDAHHYEGSCITCIDYSPNPSVAVTGNQFGILSVWNLSGASASSKILNLGSRIVSLSISQSGTLYCVGLRDRLLLVAINDDGNCDKLYTRSVLDASKGRRSIYSSCFFSGNSAEHIKGGCIMIWKATEGSDGSTLFSRWFHPNVEAPEANFKCKFRWSENTSTPSEVLNITENFNSIVISTCLEASLYVFCKNYDQALSIINLTRHQNPTLRYDKHLLFLLLNIANSCKLHPKSAILLRIVDLDVMKMFKCRIKTEPSSILDEVMLSAETFVRDVLGPLEIEGPLRKLLCYQGKIPVGADRGKVFTINQDFLISASCWRSNSFSRFYNTVRIHNLGICDCENFGEFLYSFTPILNNLSHYCANESSSRISALAFSQSGIHIAIAHHSDNADSGEIGIWSINNSCFVASLSPTRIVSSIDWLFSSTLLVLSFSEICEANKRYVFVDWQSMQVIPDEIYFSSNSKDATLKLYRQAENDVRGKRKLTNEPKDIILQETDIDFDMDICSREVEEVITSILCHEISVDEYFETSFSPIDFRIDEDHQLDLAAGTREWVFRDLEQWLHASSVISNDIDDNGLEQDCLKIWHLQSPAGFGKTVVAAAIINRFQKFVIAKHFAKIGNPSSLSDNSFCLSLAQQLNVSLGKNYQRSILLSLSKASYALVDKICRGNEEFLNKWGEPFLIHVSSRDPLARKLFLDCMRCKLKAFSDPNDLRNCAGDQTECIIIYEILTSFQIVNDMKELFVVPHVHLLNTIELFDALISQPLLELQSFGETKFLLFDGLDCVLGDSKSNMLRFIRLIALRSPAWLRLIITSRGHSDEFNKEFDDLYPHVVRLFGENHMNDTKVICRTLLQTKAYKGDIATGVQILTQRSDCCLHYLHFLQVFLPQEATICQLRQLSANVDINKFTLIRAFVSESNPVFLRTRDILEVFCAAFEPPPVGLISAALDMEPADVWKVISTDLSELMFVTQQTQVLVPYQPSLKSYLSRLENISEEFWIDSGQGHNKLCALYLKFCGNKSIAVEHTWQQYLRTYGPIHLKRSTRGLRYLTANVRKIDETSGIKGLLPYQLGYVVGLQELYARRVGLCGHIPSELGELMQLRVLSMGNNRLSGFLPQSLGKLSSLQRIVLHQNRLSGEVPPEFGSLGCIVNLAGNPGLQHGDDVPLGERNALMQIFRETDGTNWICSTHWMSSERVCQWYKVGVLASRVHSLVMSANNMIGQIPDSISQLSQLRMIELATMPGLGGILPNTLCTLRNLRRLCICRCGLKGRIPDQIGQLGNLEELQLFGNELVGKVPDSISMLRSLRLLSLGEYTGGNKFGNSIYYK